MDREAWHAAIHGVAKNRTRLSDWTELIFVLIMGFLIGFTALFSFSSYFSFFLFSFFISSLCECVSFFGRFCLWSIAITVCLRILSVHPFFCLYICLTCFFSPSFSSVLYALWSPELQQRAGPQLKAQFWSRRTEFRTLDQRTPEPIDHQLVRVLQKASKSTLRLLLLLLSRFSCVRLCATP